MVSAIVMIDAENSRIPEIASQIAGMDGVSEAFSVTGEIDIIAIVRVDHYEKIADIISDKISKVDGVLSTRTYFAFKTYSQADLDEAFHLGLD